MIGSLMHLTASRPNIVFFLCLCATFQSDPRESHLAAVQRIFRYLKGTEFFGLWYPKDFTMSLLGYTDAGFLVDRNSTSGMAQFLGPCLVLWGSKKQNYVALSTTEAEYVATTACCSQLLWLKQKLSDFGMDFSSIKILCDNTSTINISKNHVHHSRTKHIDIRHHFLRDHVEKGNIVLDYCRTGDQVADIFTKALNREQYENLRLHLGLIPLAQYVCVIQFS